MWNAKQEMQVTSEKISSRKDTQKRCCQAKCHLADLMTGREVKVIYDCHKRGFTQNAKMQR